MPVFLFTSAELLAAELDATETHSTIIPAYIYGFGVLGTSDKQPLHYRSRVAQLLGTREQVSNQVSGKQCVAKLRALYYWNVGDDGS
jgi:hypothetical protein